MALGHGSLSDNGQGEGMPTPGGGGLFANKKTDPLTSSRSEAFRTLKPICNSLMAQPLISLTNYPQTIRHLTDLHQTLLLLRSTLPARTFNPSLINYIAFPLTHILQRNDIHSLPERVLEGVFDCLGFLFERWKGCEGGMEKKAWEEMWVVVIIVLGGNLDGTVGSGGGGGEGEGEGSGSGIGRKMETGLGIGGKDKGKGRELTEETRLAGLRFLHVLLDPSRVADGNTIGSEEEHADDMEVSDQEYRESHPSPSMLSSIFPPFGPSSSSVSIEPKRSLLPFLFHTITTLLNLINPSSNPNSNIRTSSLQLLRTLTTTYLDPHPEILATLMPGMISTCVKVISEDGKGKGLKSDVGMELCGLVGDVIGVTIGDEELVERGVLVEEVTRLDQLGEGMINGIEEELQESSEKKDDIGVELKSDGPAFPALTKQYLEFTSTQLVTSLNTIIPLLLGSHSQIVRLAMVRMVSHILRKCTRSFKAGHSILVSALLRSTLDSMPQIQEAARSALLELLEKHKDLLETVETLLRNNLSKLPSAILSFSENKVLDIVSVITAIARAQSDFSLAKGWSGSTSTNFFGNLLGPDGGIERWIWPLLGSLELGGSDTVIGGMNRGGAGHASTAWNLARIEGGGLPRLLMPDPTQMGDSPTTPLSSFPEINLVHVESRATSKSILEMFEAIGAAAHGDAFFALEYLLSLAKTRHSDADQARAVSALWIVECLLRGINDAELDGPARKRLRKFARGMVGTLLSIADDENDDDLEDAGFDQSRSEKDGADSTALTERKKGVDVVSSLLQQPGRTTTGAKAETRKRHRQNQHDYLIASSLSLMALSSEILSSSFRPVLLSSLYFLLSHLGSPSPLISTHAEVALLRISYHSGYATPHNLVLENVDYVINTVSQRMTYKVMSPYGPAVLIAAITLAGDEIVPLVQDIVDDIFDLLDDYHGYEVLASTFLAVLDTLLKAMAKDADLESWRSRPSTSMRMRPPPSPETDFDKLRQWLDGRAAASTKVLDELLEAAPKKLWGPEEEAESPAEPPSGLEQEQETPPTRTQEVCAHILNKAVFFLTHPSAFLRARVLSLMASGIPVMVIGARESEVLPIVHCAWPYILNRLKDPEPYVVNEAAALIACLSRWVGDFMSRRILEDAWPVLRGLLDTRKHLDTLSALAKREQVLGSASPFSVSHRLHLSILRVMLYTAEEVPIVDSLLWEMILLFRPFLDTRANEELQRVAVQMYRMMALRDEDAVWLALKATTGEVSGEAVQYMLEPGMRITDNVRKILE